MTRRYLDRMRDVGIPESAAHRIVETLNEIAAQRSALRRKAAQGGWLDSDAYVDALDVIADGQRVIRSRYGDDIFDRYLFAAREPNRVLVSSTLAGGRESIEGLQPGDVILRLGESRCFSILEFRQCIGHLDPADVVTLTLHRRQKRVTLKATGADLRQLEVEPGYARP